MTRILTTVLAGLMTLMIMLALAGVVYAQGDSVVAAEPNAVEQFTTMAFQILTPVVTLFVMWAAHRAITALEKKVGIQIPAAQEEAIDSWIVQGILWAEEKSRNSIKKHATKLTGPEKLETAGDFVMGMIRLQRWDTWASGTIKAKIESKLGHQRATGGKPRLDNEKSPDFPEPATLVA